MLKHINENEFEEKVKKNKGVCLVDFYATWCGPCMMLAPVLEDIANSRAGYDIYKVDVDENNDLAKKLDIDTIPTICIYKDGKIVERQVGFRNKEEIVELIEKYR